MNAERLLKLAEHLESGKLGQNKFDFTIFHNPGPCGTAGCAIGECPFVFPDEWRFKPDYHGTILPTTSKFAANYPLSDVRDFFGITAGQANHLFSPEGQDTERYGGEYLFNNATPAQVAANIRAFVAKKGEPCASTIGQPKS